MSWFSKIFGSKASSDTTAREAPSVDYKGFTIRPAPYSESGQFQTAGFIDKMIGDELKSHRFVRADRQADYDAAVAFTVMKARNLIDQQGERLFD